jgi:hypothetical protein
MRQAGTDRGMRHDPSQARIVIPLFAILAVPVILTFSLHLVEHAIPLGFTRGSAGLIFPAWCGWALMFASAHLAIPTWGAIGIAAAMQFVPRLGWPARCGAAWVAAFAYISMRDMTALLHACWGEVPHFPWCIFRC